MRRFLAATLTAAMVFGPLVNAYAAPPAHAGSAPAVGQPSTPITHLVVIFQENVSFDHYFGTYPNALNPPTAVRRTQVSLRCPARRPSTATRPRC